MTRRHLMIACEGNQIVGSLDTASGRTALLLVSGGNEVRSGAWNGQALFAARVAAEGYPVLRFDRRGVGDSEGINVGFRSSGPDIVAALRALREECPQVERVVGFGNCDAASALMLYGGEGFASLVLSNPWTIEDDCQADEAPAEVIRHHYRRRVADPAAIKRLLTGKVPLAKLARSLISAIRPTPPKPDGLAAEIAAGIASFSGPVRFLVAERDGTGLAFLSRWGTADPRIRICPGATHSYVEPAAQEWLLAQVMEAVQA